VTLEAGSSITAHPFVSSISPSNQGGGVVAILTNSLQMAPSSTISATAKGFAGGVAQDASTSSDCSNKQTAYVCPNKDLGAMKGASIVPYSEDSNVRQFCRGAVGNGGGGGNNHNGPGGGGANVCSDTLVRSWSGQGVSDHDS